MATMMSKSMADDCQLRDVLEDTSECDRGKLLSFCVEYIQNEMKNSIDFIDFWSVLPNVKVRYLTAIIKIMTEDRLLRDVLADTPEDDRGKLISFCLKYIPIEMNFIEGIVFISALTKMRLLDVDNVGRNRRHIRHIPNQTQDLKERRCVIRMEVYSSYCSFDDDGRIIRLELRNYINGINSPANIGRIDVPATIGRLERLTDLKVFKPRSLPADELSKLSQFRTLELFDCSSVIFEYFPIQMKLRHLKKLRVANFQIEFVSVSSPFLTWMTRQLPSLEVLDFVGMKKNETNFIVDHLVTNDVICFQESLKYLGVQNCQVDENIFETIMFKICPKFEKLIYNIGGYIKQNYDSDIEYALNINHAGRKRIVVASALSANGRSLHFPLSMWPTVLERAYKNSVQIYSIEYHPDDIKNQNRSADGVYDLFRYGFAGRHD
ncbi:hypothetical protein FRACYDRAFT_231843 [Fragilariopsis cylindrus CCMP1102]|uniref:RNI-like protein n=1 Tax=Fragilariopsis cylindrus CCMP1102 TaxID=635003 RepID=A0A1E7FU60_9STRA|nr:hypothetical protein FRACYDRAFT_231843 [Fragilariopsis cylindrus CCMP1102]|eukprot:OEU21700.1 hypothetical protein FRACYDRAFT_231843 [Fragilariopsis cylindrus CCMP1102]